MISAPLDVKELAKGLADEFKATIESSTEKSKALKISFEADEKENFNVSADRNKIRQVISNLIDNSIKYTPQGFVKVSLSKISETGNVLLKIEDSGIGISPETMPNLFKKFGRAKSLSSIYASGSGLGLYVAKEIIKAHKGKIWAESDGEGKGSRFLWSCLKLIHIYEDEIHIRGGRSNVGRRQGRPSSSIANILQSRGFKVTSIKIDPYVNVDAGTMNPTEHGEVFVLDDGMECDQDMGNYERF